jgi:hypothetical protein
MNSYSERAVDFCFAWAEARPKLIFHLGCAGPDIYTKKTMSLIASIYGCPLLCSGIELNGIVKI